MFDCRTHFLIRGWGFLSNNYAVSLCAVWGIDNFAAGAKPVWGYVKSMPTDQTAGMERGLFECHGAMMPILHAAVSGMDDKIVARRDRKGKTIQYRKEIAKLLLDTFDAEQLNLSTEATILMHDGQFRQTRLHENVFQTAVRIGSKDIVEKLLSAGALAVYPRIALRWIIYCLKNPRMALY